MRASLKRVLISSLAIVAIGTAATNLVTDRPDTTSGHPAAPKLAAVEAPPAGTDSTSAAITRPENDRTGRTAAAGAKIARFDPVTQKAVVKAGRDSVVKGDVIASPPVEGAPKGVLVKVTETRPVDEGTIEVRTTPATVPELLGDAEIDSTLGVAAKDIAAVALAKGVQISVKGPGELTRSRPDSHAVAAVRMDVDVQLPPEVAGDAAPKLKAWVEFQPEVIFSYHRNHWLDLAPSKASVGLVGAYDYGWKIQGTLDTRFNTGNQPLRIPFAEIDTTNTFWIGPVPVVVSAKLNYFYQISADGKITIDTEQQTTGQLVVGVEYTKDGGWQKITPPEPKTTGRPALVSGAANAKAMVGANAEVSLYDSVGVSAQFAPYVRAHVAGTAASAPEWGLYLGFGLTGSLDARLKIFGITVLQASIEFPAVRQEWRVAGSDPATTTPVLSATPPLPTTSSPPPSSPAPTGP